MPAPMRPALLAAVAALAGCAGHVHTPSLDTGLIPPGETRALDFGTADVTLHCHPHPFMEHEVRIVPEGPTEAHVHILDGNATEEFGFEPRVLEVGAGARVAYHNHGALEHTATAEAAHRGH